MNDLAPFLRPAAAPSPRFEIRSLTGHDAEAYRALRQRILALGDGRFFSDSYEREGRLITPGRWRDWCEEKRGHCIMGTFANDALIGVMMITQQGEGSPVVEWEATWLDPLFRRHGIGKAAYEQVYQWSLERGFDFAAVFIRADNRRSQDIRRQQGFAYAYTVEGETWADGSTADANAYVMGLRAPTPEERRQIALDHLQEVLAFLDQRPGPDENNLRRPQNEAVPPACHGRHDGRCDHHQAVDGRRRARVSRDPLGSAAGRTGLSGGPLRTRSQAPL
jgi:GNAT superfamily N-acetyltransferase